MLPRTSRETMTLGIDPVKYSGVAVLLLRVKIRHLRQDWQLCSLRARLFIRSLMSGFITSKPPDEYHEGMTATLHYLFAFMSG